MKTYDEDSELDRYVWAYCSQSMSKFETRVGRAAMAEFKADHASSSMADMLRRRWGCLSDPAIAEALSDGWPKYRRSVRRRLLVENIGELVVNRCPECLCVVRTPMAQQCLWCGHDWHAKSDG